MYSNAPAPDIPDYSKIFNLNPSTSDIAPSQNAPQFIFSDVVNIPSPQQIKQNIIEPIIDQRMTVYDSLRQGIPATWEKLFLESAPHLSLISDLLQKDEQINGMWYPLKQDLFRAFRYCPLTVPNTNIPYLKVVIIGMDPYPQYLNGNPNYPKAVGMSFSIRPEDKDIPKSLHKIFEEMEQSIPGYRMPRHGDLTDLATQGVLFLNSCLTYSSRANPPHVKTDIWRGFMLNVINIITETCPGAIFVMWGRDAQKLEKDIPPKMMRLNAMHPANRQNAGFLGCGHFRIINETLISRNQTPINWQT
jgi:uracil-DNA glycosylase